MTLIDTHAHLYSEAFEEDRKEVVDRAIAAGVEKIFLPAIDSATTQAMYDLAEAYPGKMHLMMGLHPCSVQEAYKEELKHVEEQFRKDKKFYAVGEIGIDLHWDKSTLSMQQDAFRKQIKLAKKLGLPIVIHCRKAFDEIFEILEEEKDEKLYGIFHCFTGNLEQAHQALSYNLKLGIGGVVTFKNGKIDKFLDQIPLSEIVLETDAPYLAPSPFRGKRNESAYLVEIKKKLAEIYGLSWEEIAEQTTKNAKEIFRIV
ncbi:TatD family hydrolase [Haloflavibacter putidus]|uniref:TatD family deoxyribonuclease n=1 Tax=Haloflavibacter putidus TaxID=2576776 RepID=A0A507ZV02_9FLAO|nr:TatD family hydrolase [Haloflavibacter putidus]TQD40441.1 TatD family deoxyribonuclease [Haloflavibacter putidus]